MSQINGESVVAESGTQFDFDFLALPGNRRSWVPKWGFKTEAPTFDPRFDIGGQFGGWHYGVKAYAGYGGEIGSDKEAKRGPAVNEYCDFAGVFGTGIYVTGVAGTSVNNIGVYGQAGEGPIGDFLGGGVVGASFEQVGVYGWSELGLGVVGVSESDMQPAVAGLGLSSAVVGTCRTPGPNPPMNLPTIAGVLGTSDTQAGVIGTSNMTAGVLGFSNNVGVYGVGANYAAIFRGNFLVVGGTKAAAVPFPDGTQRVLYCMESPDLWFEDFGAAKLKRGRVVVRLDADFAKVIKRDYRVFFTPEGDCRGLYLRRKSAARFEVRELMGGKSSIAFSYRIVGRRKDIKAPPRFAKFDTRLPLPAAATRAARKSKPTPAELRAFMARVEKVARLRAPKGARTGGRSRALPKGMRRSRFMRRLAKT
jgi:hypothetical protein